MIHVFYYGQITTQLRRNCAATVKKWTTWEDKVDQAVETAEQSGELDEIIKNLNQTS